MTESKLSYLGPLPKALSFQGAPSRWRRAPWGFGLVVLLPTLVAAVYFLLIASPRYVSEAQFVVRQAGQTNTASLGMALQGIGIAPAQSDAFAVHEYISSRDGLRELTRRYDVARLLSPPGTDPFSRYPAFGERRTQEGLYEALQRFVDVGYDSTTGISTLRVEAFRARDAQAMAETLLDGGESLVNRLNVRASADAVQEATIARDLARNRLAEAQAQLTAFRNREAFVDPEETGKVSAELIGGLMATVATLRAERSQIAGEAPNSPQLAVLDGRIRAYERQIAEERAKLSGASNSLAPRIGVYETLTLNRELADRELTQATAALVSAEQDARRQKLYLDRVVNPNLPDEAIEPRRWLSILTVFITCLLLYGIGWLVWAGVNEHRQD